MSSLNMINKENKMKITHVTSEVFEWDRPAIWNGSHFYDKGRLHKVTVYTDQGLVGSGWNGGTASTRPFGLMPRFVDYYRPLMIGKNPLDTRRLLVDLWERQIKILGPAGLHTQALAALLAACADIKGKEAGLPLYKMLGGARDKVRAYIAGGYYAEGKDLARLKAEMTYNVEELHATAVKMKIGDPAVGVSGDLERIAAVREAVGPNVLLLTDANCACDRATASEFAEAMDDYDVYWFEEPLPIYDFEGYGMLASGSRVKIATGENYYLFSDFETLLKCGGAAVLNVDVAICPGYDVAGDVARLALDSGVSVAPHGCQEMQLSLVAGVKNGELLEYYPTEVDPLRAEMFQPSLVLGADGFVDVPATPGIGFDLNMDLLNRYRVA
jgi:L-alanine-DL-glutamate epimerase-like enolase superfamily enzyme